MRSVFARPVCFTSKRVKRRDVAFAGRQVRMLAQYFHDAPEFDAGIPAALNILEPSGRLEIVLYIKNQRVF